MREPDSPATLPDEALVVRGGRNLPENFVQGSGIAVDEGGKVRDVSVNSSADRSLAALTAPRGATGYPGIPHRQVGATTVGAIRAAGGDVIPSSTRANPYHATMSGLTPDRASELFRPTIPNPSRRDSPSERS